MAFYLKRSDKRPLSLAVNKDLGILLWVAQEKGIFKDYKIDIKFHMVPYARKAMELLLESKVDCSVLVETNVAYLGFLKPNTPIKCFASIEKRSTDCIITRNKMTPYSLVGKTIGFIPRTTSHSFLMKFLEHHKIPKSKVKVKDIPLQAMAKALIRGEIDAISIWDAHAQNTCYAMDKLDLQYTCFENSGFYQSEVVLAANKPFLIKNTHQIKKLLKSLQAASCFIQENAEEITPLLKQKLKLISPNTHHILKKHQSTLSPIETPYLENINVLAKRIKQEDTSFQGQATPNYSDLVDNQICLDVLKQNPL